jgi:hypothetical protein
MFIKNLNPEVNWLYKEHPSEYGLKFSHAISSITVFNEIIGSQDNIKIFPKKFNTILLKDVANCVLTSQGSAGIEYPCFGTPSITGGDSFYNGLGFSHNPENKDQYFSLLANMPKIASKKLTPDQVDLARISFYFYNKATKLDHPLLDDYEITKESDFNIFFDKSIDLISKYKEEDDIFKRRLKIQLENIDRHLTVI